MSRGKFSEPHDQEDSAFSNCPETRRDQQSLPHSSTTLFGTRTGRQGLAGRISCFSRIEFRLAKNMASSLVVRLL